MKSFDFKDLESLNSPIDIEGVTRPKKDATTKLFKLRVRGIGNAALILKIYAETETDAIKHAKARWNNCRVEVIK